MSRRNCNYSFSDDTALSIVNTDVLFNLFDVTIPPKHLRENIKFEFIIFGLYLNNTGANRQFSIVCNVNSTRIYKDQSSNVSTSADVRSFLFKGTLTLGQSITLLEGKLTITDHCQGSSFIQSVSTADIGESNLAAAPVLDGVVIGIYYGSLYSNPLQFRISAALSFASPNYQFQRLLVSVKEIN